MIHIVRKHVIHIVLGVVTLLLLSIIWLKGTRVLPAKKSISCNHCNIIFIDIDDFRADALPCSGYHRNTTPNICALASRGVLFSHNVSQSYWTLPSTFSTITGIYPSAHRMLTEDMKLSPSFMTLAELLKSAGYFTVFAGIPNDTALSESNGGLRGYDSVPFTKTITSYVPHRIQQEMQLINKWVDVFKMVSTKGRPFFIHFYTQIPHIPYFLPEGFPYIEQLTKPDGFPETPEEVDSLMKQYVLRNYRDIFQDEGIQERKGLFINSREHSDEIFQYFQSVTLSDRRRLLNHSWSHFYKAYIGWIQSHDEEAYAYLRMLYDTNLAYIDGIVGQIIVKVLSLGLERKTIMVVMSSHGEEFSEHGRFSHEGGSYNELILTPLVIVTPNVGSRIVDSVTQNIDIAPTILTLVGEKSLTQFQGQSLLSLIYGEDDKTERYAVSEFDEPGVGASIQNTEWKLILSSIGMVTESVDLYNLHRDPTEQTNVASEEQTITDKLTRKLKIILQQSSLRYPGALYPSSTPLETLRKGGYF